MALDGNQVTAAMPPIIRGGTYDKVFRLKTALGADINISAWYPQGATKIVRGQLRTDSTTTTITATPTFTILDSGTTGRVRIYMAASVTTAIPNSVSALFCDPEFVIDTGVEVVSKPVKLTFSLVEEYTK